MLQHNAAEGTTNREQQALIIAPLGRDGPLLLRALNQAGIDAMLCENLPALRLALRETVGLLLLTVEALDEVNVEGFAALLENQPPWSDIPVILLVGETVCAQTEAFAAGLGHVTILERPVRLPALLAAVRAALRARKRQCEVRDLLIQSEIQNAHIEALNERLQRAMTETHHRVKNNLQVIAAMVDLRIMDDQPTIPVSEFKRLSRHIRMLATVHDLLTQEAKEDGQATSVSTKAMLEKLLPIMQQIAPECNLEYEVDDLRMPARQGTSLTVIVNELVSNALKHGKSMARIDFHSAEAGAVLEVSDDGPGFPAGFDSRRSANTGLELVENLSRWDLAGKVEFERSRFGGALVRVTIPLHTNVPVH